MAQRRGERPLLPREQALVGEDDGDGRAVPEDNEGEHGRKYFHVGAPLSETKCCSYGYHLLQALRIFKEPVDYDITAGVPELRDLTAQVGERLEIGFAEWADHIAEVNLEIEGEVLPFDRLKADELSVLWSHIPAEDRLAATLTCKSLNKARAGKPMKTSTLAMLRTEPLQAWAATLGCPLYPYWAELYGLQGVAMYNGRVGRVLGAWHGLQSAMASSENAVQRTDASYVSALDRDLGGASSAKRRKT